MLRFIYSLTQSRDALSCAFLGYLFDREFLFSVAFQQLGSHLLSQLLWDTTTNQTVKTAQITLYETG